MFSCFHIFIFSYFHIFIFSYLYIHIFIFSHLHIFMFSYFHVFIFSCFHFFNVFMFSYFQVFMFPYFHVFILGWFFSLTCHIKIKSWVPSGSFPGDRNFTNQLESTGLQKGSCFPALAGIVNFAAGVFLPGRKKYSCWQEKYSCQQNFDY